MMPCLAIYLMVHFKARRRAIQRDGENRHSLGFVNRHMYRRFITYVCVLWFTLSFYVALCVCPHVLF